ncbi:hypothetical protein HY213_05795 [Candidatus Peregrinibacteria bacterium]|nr:hypothetical protein [Candidatus Peregrinibacteria bacterium]
MSQETLGILIGGFIPALVYGVSGVFTKASTDAGVSIAFYLLAVAGGVIISALAFLVFSPHRPSTLAGLTYAGAFGLLWGVGTGCVALALTAYAAPISKLVPLYNMNTLIGVVLSLWIFAEWKDVALGRLAAGTLLIVVGSVLVAGA